MPLYFFNPTFQLFNGASTKYNRLTCVKEYMDRDYLTPEQSELVTVEAKRVAAKVLKEISEDDRKFLKTATGIELTMAKISLGRFIRNDEKMWLGDHPVTSIWMKANSSDPRFDGEVDCHPCHPDNFSGLCIAELFGMLK